MGNTKGMPIFDDDELGHLSEADREKLKQDALEEIRTNQEIRDLLKTKPEVFADRQDVRDIVKRKLKPWVESKKS
jgi:hypothetical protein